MGYKEFISPIKNYISIEKIKSDPEYMKEYIINHLYYDNRKYWPMGEAEKYELIKFILYFYKEDKDFISTVANTYIGYSFNNKFITEIYLIMFSLTKRYYYKEFLIDSILHDIELNPQFDRSTGFGFINFIKKYENFKEVLDYCAKVMIKYIFAKFNVDLETLIYLNFNNYEELAKYGFDNFIINYILNFDKDLALYLSDNKHLLNEFKHKINISSDKMDTHLKNMEKFNYKYIINVVTQLMQYAIDELSLTGDQMLYLIGITLGIHEKIFEYHGIDSMEYSKILEQLSSIDINDLKNDDREYFEYFSKTIQSILVDGDYDPFILRPKMRYKRKKINNSCY